MKLVVSNGKVLEVYDLGPMLYRVHAGPNPVKHNGYHIMEDDRARQLLQNLKNQGYRGENLSKPK